MPHKDGAPATVGKAHTRRTRTDSAAGGRIESIDPLGGLALKRNLRDAIQILTAAGFEAQRLLETDPAGRVLLDAVLNGSGPEEPGHDWDSEIGLAALIAWNVIQLEGWQQHPGTASRQIAHAYTIGRLITLADVYRREGSSLLLAREKAKNARSAKALKTRKKVAAAFSKLTPTQQGSSAAGLIARKLKVSEPTVRDHLNKLGKAKRK